MKSSIVIALVAIAGAVWTTDAGAATRHGVHAGWRAAQSVHRLRTARPLHQYSALARAYGARDGRVQRVSMASPTPVDSNSPEGVGFIKDADHAGYGVKGDHSEALVGAYRRPKDVNLPGTDMYHEGKGAAGVSWSVTLGGSH